MSYWKHVEEFLGTLINSSNPTEDLKTENIAQAFIDFMKSKDTTFSPQSLYQEYSDSQSEAQSAGSKSSESLEEFVCKYCLGLYSDVVDEYNELFHQMTEYTKLVAAKKAYFDQQTHNAQSNKEKNRYKGYSEALKALMNKVDGRTKTPELIRMAIRNSCVGFGIAYAYREGFTFDIMKVRNIDSDRRRLIYFGELPVKDADEMLSLRDQNHEEYLQRFRRMIDEHGITRALLEIVKGNPFMSSRAELIKTAVELFASGNYQAFVYLITPQVEGLFNEYRGILGDISPTFGMQKVMEKIRKAEDFAEYDYFQFDFTDLRNAVAHGQIVNISSEDAYNVLMSVYFVAQMVDDDDMPYKQWISFMRELQSCQTQPQKIDSILRYFDGQKYYCSDHIELLNSYLDGSYDRAIEGYDMRTTEQDFMAVLSSSELYKAVQGDTVHYSDLLQVLSEHNINSGVSAN